MHQQLEQVETKSSMRSKQIQVVKIFGERVREARELCGFSQVKAAELLGYQNSSKLAKIEGATDTNSIPIWLIVRAAHIYDVSCDFLFGISDDWERDPVVSQQRQVGRWLFDHWEKAKLAEVNAIRMLSNKICTLEKMASKLLNRSQENLEMLRKVQELNPEVFDELKGGAKLLRLLTETAEDAMGISYELKRYKAVNEVAKKHDVDLFD
jgi:transcriptional regulator with XRE-family HTH domain